MMDGDFKKYCIVAQIYTEYKEPEFSHVLYHVIVNQTSLIHK